MTISPKLFYVVLTGLFLFMISFIIATTDSVKMKNKHQKEMERINKEQQIKNDFITKTHAKLIEFEKIKELQDKKIEKLETSLDSTRKKHSEKVKEILGMNQEEIAEYINKDSGGDSTVLALHLEERQKLLRENEIIIEQADIIKSKMIIQDSIIYNQNVIIVNMGEVIKGYEYKEAIYTDELERLNRKLKRAKILNKVGTGAIIVGAAVLMLL